jgi:hypothetical protein
MKKKSFSFIALLFAIIFAYSQKLLVESVQYEKLQKPKIKLSLNQENYKFTIKVPYTMKAEDLEKVAKQDFQDKLTNYDNVVKQSEVEFQEKLKNYDLEVQQEKEKFKLESEEFSKLSLIERLALQEQGKKPQLRIPSKPVYVKPAKPIYSNPDLSDYLIFDSEVMASKLELKGFAKGENGINFEIDFNNMEFQDNSNQVYGKQPTLLKVKVNNEIVEEKIFSNDFTYLTSGSSVSIRRNYYENQSVSNILGEIQKYVNENYGYKTISVTSRVYYIKNKGDYDDLERAKVYAVSGFSKMKLSNSEETKSKASTEIDKAIQIWKSKLELVNYKDKNSVYNSNVAKAILFNLVGAYIDINDKKSAEEYFSILQENKIFIKFDYDEERYYEILETSLNKM